MFRVLFLLFIIIPIIEISVLIQVGSFLGLWPTIAIVIFTAWLGAQKVREQGLATLTSIQTKMAQGEMPSDEIVTGVLLLVAGVLLVTPGFVTDFFGIALLFPFFRNKLTSAVKKHLMASQQNGQFHATFVQTHNFTATESNSEEQKSQSSHTLEGEFERKD
jgi:UPF0716 protein FxsA